MKTDIAGRVRNVNVPASRPLLPLFEAVVNSIQAIEDVKERHGTITIKIIRDLASQMFDGDKSARDIKSFEVTDNGIGFTDDNFTAFQTSDTTYKADRGGKGIGRFVWLAAFDAVEIDSTFRAGQAWVTRSFKFVPNGDGVAGEARTKCETGRRETTVRLLGLKAKFRHIPKRLDTIAAHIVEHCLEYLIRENPPRITLSDEATGERLSLNEIFEKEMAANSKSVPFKVGDTPFNILHVRLYSSHIKDHQLHYCANNRAVKADKLAGRVPDLAKRLVDQEGSAFVYASYVDSPLLDETVNQERTDFNITADDGSLFPNRVKWEDIRSAATAQSKQYLAPFTKPIQEKKEQRIERFVATEGPMYRPILKYVGDDLDTLDADVDDDELDLRLYKAYHDLQVRLRVEGHDLIQSQAKNQAEYDHFAAKFEDYFSKVSDVNQADLARYVFHRRLVLEFLQKLLAMQPDGKYPVESRVHQLIFPMGATSDDVPFDQHNLWLVDERLAYHKFLASDKQLRVTKPLVNTSQKELDIVVFDKACAFAGTNEGPFQTITIIEFKRPMRTNYPDDDNPFDQVLEYIEEIRAGKARTDDGRDVPVSPGVHFFCYIVADKTEKLEQQAYKAELEMTPDGQGFFGYKKHYRAYVEFISYSKLHADAKQRNRVFFDKLGLPACLPAATSKPASTAMKPEAEAVAAGAEVGT